MKDVNIPDGLIIVDLFGDIPNFSTPDALEVVLDVARPRHAVYLGNLTMPKGGFAVMYRCVEAPHPMDYKHWTWKLARKLAGNGAVHFVNQDREVTRLFARTEKGTGTLYKGKLVYQPGYVTSAPKYINEAGNSYRVVR